MNPGEQQTEEDVRTIRELNERLRGLQTAIRFIAFFAKEEGSAFGLSVAKTAQAALLASEEGKQP